MAHNDYGLAMAGYFIKSCREPKLIEKLKIEIMDKKLSKEKSARTKADSEQKDEKMHVSPAIAKPHVGGSLLSQDVTDFIEWIYLSDEWHWSAKEQHWYQYGYRERTTQQLFEYFLKYKTR